MLFHNAFPDVTIAFALTRDALITATEKHGHGGGIVQRRLEVDGEYLTKLVSLVSFTILETTLLKFFDSRAYDFPFSAARSRSAATQLAYRRSSPLVRQLKYPG
jgi:hypothetical protein